VGYSCPGALLFCFPYFVALLWLIDMSVMRPNCWAIIVTSHPDQVKISRLVELLIPQVEGVVVVDNGSSCDELCGLASYQSTGSLHLIRLHENKGIAAAQNTGISYARGRGAEFVVMFDHDSAPASDMVARLVEAAKERTAIGVDVAAVGPRYLDERQDNPPPFITIDGLRIRRRGCEKPDSVVEVSYLIASGCLIPMKTLEIVGDMREGLFIDYVDIEWGLRARKMGFRSFGACGATMVHELGDEPIRFMGRNIPLHSPLRHYYHFRNAVWLYRQGWLSWQWKVADGWRLLMKYGFYTLFAQPRHKHWQMMTKGIWHGVTGRLGRYH
jgi:rhamnosyltransferase